MTRKNWLTITLVTASTCAVFVHMAWGQDVPAAGKPPAFEPTCATVSPDKRLVFKNGTDVGGVSAAATKYGTKGCAGFVVDVTVPDDAYLHVESVPAGTFADGQITRGGWDEPDPVKCKKTVVTLHHWRKRAGEKQFTFVSADTLHGAKFEENPGFNQPHCTLSPGPGHFDLALDRAGVGNHDVHRLVIEHTVDAEKKPVRVGVMRVLPIDVRPGPA
jgi:hypothetical protein